MAPSQRILSVRSTRFSRRLKKHRMEEVGDTRLLTHFQPASREGVEKQSGPVRFTVRIGVVLVLFEVTLVRGPSRGLASESPAHHDHLEKALLQEDLRVRQQRQFEQQLVEHRVWLQEREAAQYQRERDWWDWARSKAYSCDQHARVTRGRLSTTESAGLEPAPQAQPVRTTTSQACPTTAAATEQTTAPNMRAINAKSEIKSFIQCSPCAIKAVSTSLCTATTGVIHSS